MFYEINKIQIMSNLKDFTEQDAQKYINYVLTHIDPTILKESPLKEINVVMCDDGTVDVNYKLQGQKFERIRRVTGYLTGSLDSWNNAKRSEERERVKHDFKD